MDNIILNIVNKKQNLSYPLIFKKIGKYYWNKKEIERFFNTVVINIIEKSIENKWYKILKILIHIENGYALCWAATKGYLEVVKYLVENGADIHANNDYALRWAAGDGYLEVVKYLVENKANIHAQNDFALRVAAERGRLEVVKHLIEKGANIHANNDYALRWAAYNDHSEIVKYLIEKGANIHIKNNHFFLIKDDILKLLIQKMKKTN